MKKDKDLSLVTRTAMVESGFINNFATRGLEYHHSPISTLDEILKLSLGYKEASLKRILDFEKQKLPVTGIFEVLRNSRRASRDPRVEACTKTPRSFTLMEFSAESSLLETKKTSFKTKSRQKYPS